MNRMTRRQRGFTLIEVMIVVLIIAVLAAIVYPSYGKHVVKTRRAAAAACLLETAQLVERFYTTNLTYEGAPISQCGGTVDQFYTIGFSGTAARRSYTLQAVPKGVQLSKDTECGTLSITSQGVKSVSNRAASVTNCF